MKTIGTAWRRRMISATSMPSVSPLSLISSRINFGRRLSPPRPGRLAPLEGQAPPPGSRAPQLLQVDHGQHRFVFDDQNIHGHLHSSTPGFEKIAAMRNCRFFLIRTSRSRINRHFFSSPYCEKRTLASRLQADQPQSRNFAAEFPIPSPGSGPRRPWPGAGFPAAKPGSRRPADRPQRHRRPVPGRSGRCLRSSRRRMTSSCRFW